MAAALVGRRAVAVLAARVLTDGNADGGAAKQVAVRVALVAGALAGPLTATVLAARRLTHWPTVAGAVVLVAGAADLHLHGDALGVELHVRSLHGALLVADAVVERGDAAFRAIRFEDVAHDGAHALLVDAAAAAAVWLKGRRFCDSVKNVWSVCLAGVHLQVVLYALLGDHGHGHRVEGAQPQQNCCA